MYLFVDKYPGVYDGAEGTCGVMGVKGAVPYYWLQRPAPPHPAGSSRHDADLMFTQPDGYAVDLTLVSWRARGPGGLGDLDQR